MSGWEGDWSSAEALRGRRPIAVLNQLRAALVERTSVMWDDGVKVLPSALDTGMLIKADWFDDFVNIRNDVMLQYCNHTDSGGDWRGSATAPPGWTKSTIAAALGVAEAAMDVLPAGNPGITTWAAMQYNIINLLKWFMPQAYPAFGVKKLILRQAFGPGELTEDAAWTEALNVWENNPDIQIQEDTWGASGFFLKRIGRTLSNTFAARLRFRTPHFAARQGDPDCYVDWWASLSAAKFETLDKADPGTEGVYSLISSHFRGSEALVETSDLNYSQPETNPSTSSTDTGWATDGGRFVIRFDIPGGFEYGDW